MTTNTDPTTTTLFHGTKEARPVVVEVIYDAFDNCPLFYARWADTGKRIHQKAFRTFLAAKLVADTYSCHKLSVGSFLHVRGHSVNNYMTPGLTEYRCVNCTVLADTVTSDRWAD